MAGDDDDEPFVSPTAERIAKAGANFDEVATESGRRTVRLLDGSVLDFLLSRSVITGDQYNAGAQFYMDWYVSGLAASGVIDPGRIVVDGGEVTRETDRRLDALTRWKNAVQAVGLTHSHVLTAVVLTEQPLIDYGWRRFGLKDDKDARLKAVAVLQAALDQLDYHYYGKRKGVYREGHAAGYRPEIQPKKEEDEK